MRLQKDLSALLLLWFARKGTPQLSSMIPCCPRTMHASDALFGGENWSQFIKLRLGPFYKPVCETCKGWLLLPGAPHHFSHFYPSGEKKNLCIILKPIVAYLVGREHAFPTGRAFVCGSASFKFSFIPAPLPMLWPIISCNIGHPRLCEAPAPFAFLIRMEQS